MRLLCYCRSIPLPKEIIIKCDHCGKEYRTWDTHYRHQIFSVSEIKTLGYDVDLEILCTNCLYKRLFEENCIKDYDDLLLKENDSNIRLFYLFKFKARGQEKWHLSIAEEPTTIER